MLLPKVFVGALTIVAATFAARRWGDAAGGRVVGLPLTSGPVSLFLALEHGPNFAAKAAHGTLLGLVGVATFCIAYAACSRRGAFAAVTGGLAAFVATVFVLEHVALPLVASFLSVCGVLFSAAWWIRPAPSATMAPAPGAWDLPLRVAATVATILILTRLAPWLGPHTSGLLSPFPVFACVLATFTLVEGGSPAAERVLHGVVVGSFGFATFFLVVAALLERAGIVPTFALATLAALVSAHAPGDPPAGCRKGEPSRPELKGSRGKWHSAETRGPAGAVLFGRTP